MLAPVPVEGASSHYLTDDVARQIAAQIREASGVEVFFIGRRGPDGLVHEVEPHAFGSRSAVPVLLHLVRPGDVILHNHPGGDLTPSEADLSISAEVGNLGVGSYIVSNDGTRIRVVIRAHDPKPGKPLAPEKIDELLGPKSPLAEVLGGYENRPQQRDMSRLLVDAFNQDGIAVVEAGTGTGKSLAYLVPAILYALQNQERVVVSTHTINLQEQLLHKDLPVVRQVIGKDFRAELVKGRSNYVCKRKASIAADEMRQATLSLIDDDQRGELREVLEWIARTPTGDLQELPVPPRIEVWGHVMSESDNCLRLRCPFYESCFFYNSRRQAARADVLVVNHSLLLSDVAVRRESNNWSTAAVLPPWHRVILDEAHHLEEVATNHLGNTITRPAFRRLFARLMRTDGKTRKGIYVSMEGDLHDLRQNAKIHGETPVDRLLVLQLMPDVDQVRDVVDHLLDQFAHEFLHIVGKPHPKRGEEHKIRITPAIEGHSAWQEDVQRILGAIRTELSAFIETNKAAISAVGDYPEEAQEDVVDTVLEWRSVTDRLENLARHTAAFLRPAEGICRWVELALDKRDRLAVKLCSAPVSVAKVLEESLHQHVRTEILTSATLAVDNRFDFLLERIGLAPKPGNAARVEHESVAMEVQPDVPDTVRQARPIATTLLDSPFDYRQQVFLGIPEDLGDPRNTDFEDRLADFLVNAIAVSEGRAFILFTSWGQMRRMHTRCAPLIRKLGLDPLVQGSEGRDKLLRRFRDDETSVLFATSSFWEGVDVRGRALELLVITKLPFAVPTEPIQEAQFESLRAKGGDPFRELVVPRAIIRFKQGFGRLIRSSDDRGAVLIADERVLRMPYGRRFLAALPPMDPRAGASADVLKQMGEFLKAKV